LLEYGSSFSSRAGSLTNRARISPHLVKKFKRVDTSRAELTMNRASQRAIIISSSPKGRALVRWGGRPGLPLIFGSSGLPIYPPYLEAQSSTLRGTSLQTAWTSLGNCFGQRPHLHESVLVAPFQTV
jgi:hypothetical protein